MKTILLTLLVLGAAASAPALETPMPDTSPANPPAATENDYPSCRKLLENPPTGISDVRIAEIFTRALILLSSMNEPQEFDRLLQLAETIVFNIGQKVILAAVIFIKCDPVKLGFGA